MRNISLFILMCLLLAYGNTAMVDVCQGLHDEDHEVLIIKRNSVFVGPNKVSVEEGVLLRVTGISSGHLRLEYENGDYLLGILKAEQE